MCLAAPSANGDAAAAANAAAADSGDGAGGDSADASDANPGSVAALAAAAASEVAQTNDARVNGNAAGALVNLARDVACIKVRCLH